MKNQKGITLVALVITIIVLLILAGVSISLVLGDNGVLNQASNAVDANEKATVKQNVEMGVASCVANFWAAYTTNSAAKVQTYLLADEIKKSCPDATSVAIAETLTAASETATVQYTTKKGNLYTVTLTINGNAVAVGEPTKVAAFN